MIKLFRNIHRKLLEQGKTTSYLKYAIGEIILVVIGIMITWNIDHWNINRIQNNKMKKHLEIIKRQLQEHLGSIDVQYSNK